MDTKSVGHGWLPNFCSVVWKKKPLPLAAVSYGRSTEAFPSQVLPGQVNSWWKYLQFTEPRAVAWEPWGWWIQKGILMLCKPCVQGLPALVAVLISWYTSGRLQDRVPAKPIQIRARTAPRRGAREPPAQRPHWSHCISFVYQGWLQVRGFSTNTLLPGCFFFKGNDALIIFGISPWVKLILYSGLIFGS